MKLENAFEVTASPEAAWDLLMDVPRVIPCMPGAELIETIDDSHWKARMGVKLGPISLSFLTDVAREEVDEAGRRVLLATKAREERGRGNATATIESSIALVGDRTQVTTVTDLALTGMAAQFGRGLIQDVTAQLLDSFAYCLEQQLATQPDNSPAPAAVEPRPVSGLMIGAAAMRDMVARHKRLTAALWAAFFFVYLWLGLLAVDVSGANAFIFSALAGASIFVLVRIGLEDDPAVRRRPWARSP
ncbi:MAG: SRPBCC family protein [Gaiellales bacterium]